jgi:hypothetical protein
MQLTGQLSSAEQMRRAAACQAFWSDRPLNRAFREQYRTSTFTLRDFTAFVIAMPAEQFLQLVGGSDAR